MTSSSAYEIVHLPHDPATITPHLSSYKALRLLSLQESPQFFGSTFSRESQLTNSEWLARFTNPAANTFLACSKDDGHALGSITIMGPLPYGAAVYNRTRAPWADTVIATPGDVVAQASRPFHFGVNGAFVLPEARGRGIAKAVLDRALAFAGDWAREWGGDMCVASVLVDSDNPIAIALYGKAGFGLSGEVELPPRADGSARSGHFMRVELRTDELSSA
jgi:ribosomal protein S18 acetylase RimI-like enzyme